MRLTKLILCFLWFNGGAKNEVDTPVEEFYGQPGAIERQVLKNVIGIASLEFSPRIIKDPYLAYDPLPIQTYSMQDGKVYKDFILTLNSIKTISGIDYLFSKLRRFPVKKKYKNYLQIVYNVKNNSTTWVKIANVTGSSMTLVGSSKENPRVQILRLDHDYVCNNTEAVNIFYLINGKNCTIYQDPDVNAKRT